MKGKYLFYVVAFMAFSFVVGSCSKKDDKPSSYDDLSTNVKKIIPESTYQVMLNLGMPVYKGTNPPNIENTYLASPFVLDTSNISSDYAGKLFSDMYIKFFDQNNTNYTIKINYENGPESASGIGGFISGDSSYFSIFAKMSVIVDGDPADIAIVVSGKLTVNGVKDMYYANFMLDNHGNPNGYYIDNNQGRLIYDGDGMSEITSDLGSKSTKSTGLSVNQK